MNRGALYLYAIVDERPARAPRGIEFVRAARAWIVVGRHEAPAVSLEAAVEHDRVVQRVAATCTAVLPLRFGTTAQSEKELATKLRPFSTAIRRALKRVRDAVQITIRVSGREMATKPGKSGPGARFLEQKAAAERVPEIEALTSALEKYVLDTRIERKPKGGAFATVFHLVARDDLKAWRRIVAKTELEGVTLEITGPWPPYAFADLA